MSDSKLLVSLSPHDKAPFTVAHIMWLVVIALVPAMVASVLVFGARVLLLYAVSILACMLTEFLVDWFRNRKKTAGMAARGSLASPARPGFVDGSAVITGILLAMNVSASLPWWQLVLGGMFAIGVGKMAFGGTGNNPFNPALAGRAFLLASFPAEMTSFPAPSWGATADALSAATPLSALKEGVAAGGSVGQLDLPGLSDLLLGLRGGSLGEVSVLAILAGGLLLLLFRVISWELPVFFLLGLGSITGLMWLVDPVHYLNPLYHLMSGGACLAAIFMVTDMVTSPMSFGGKVVFAAGAGLLAGLIRLFGSYPEGASYAILFMNALVPLLDRGFKPRRFGSKAPQSGPKGPKVAA